MSTYFARRRIGMLFILTLTALAFGQAWSASAVQDWVQRYDGPAHGIDSGQRVVVDGSGLAYTNTGTVSGGAGGCCG